MESVGKKRPRPRRAFTPQFKAEIVELCQRGDRTIRQVSQDFDLTETAVRDWVKQAEIDAGTRSDGLTSDERAELARLRQENRRLQEDVEILKRATAVKTGQAQFGHSVASRVFGHLAASGHRIAGWGRSSHPPAAAFPTPASNSDIYVISAHAALDVDRVLAALISTVVARFS
ncbi:hypothetical protein Q0Z83_008680 [Actinoplanes sichuanensis]|nr:hypothetical protein Q0Z83_008680 [Actinoplanes sichuanensis]